MREKLVAELVKEVLGPRTADIHETLENSPLNEFITGVLGPVADQTGHEIDNETEIPSEDTQTYEDEATDVDVNNPPVFHPALDPKSRPSTMGLSFTVESTENPKIDVCLTWARYKGIQNKDGRFEKWQREPKSSILQIELTSNRTYWLDSLGNISSPKNAEISFHVIVHALQGNPFLVHLYIVNRIQKPPEQVPTPDCCIFQPQIRVCKGNNTRIVPGIKKIPKGEDEQRLELSYRKRQIYARGHLCSAVWNEIDPEIAPPSTIDIDFPECVREPPFFWLDGLLLDEKQLEAQRVMFSRADVRTEFVPAYSIINPRLQWPIEFQEAPELRANKLAELWNINDLQKAFAPITKEYERWICNIENEASQFSVQQKAIADELISDCKTVLERIKAGINALCSNEEARLAFCFANKAIATQWSWAKKEEYSWRPFQIAFILLTIESIIDPKSKFRKICDVLWVPTGTGKTEAYLALTAFTIAFRRRKALSRIGDDLTGAGVSIITRYTLRLLTIQQFRRTLALITACEYLRVDGLQQKRAVGWRPFGSIGGDFIWGSTPFACGLWVGGGVSPNRLRDSWARTSTGSKQRIRGALSILREANGEGEPAQVLRCPCCDSILAVPERGLPTGEHKIHLIFRLTNGSDTKKIETSLTNNTYNGVTIVGAPQISRLDSQNYYTMTLNLYVPDLLSAGDLDSFWENVKASVSKIGCLIELMPIRPSRMGYFVRYYAGREQIEYDFEVFCPNPECELHKHWCGGLPMGWITGRDPHDLAPNPDNRHIPLFPDGNRLIDIQEPFRDQSDIFISDRIPIPALTVEDQIFQRLPTVIVATVDKFARFPFEPRAASLFGNVEYHHCIHGYYRNLDGHPSPAGTERHKLYCCLYNIPSNPDIIIQDELHLIEGPLGSLVGLYETAVDFLCGEAKGYPVKYIASTATIRRASEQIKAVFSRDLQLFPPHGLTADDRFFITEREDHALADRSAGRLYVGICAPGRGPLTPLVRIWAKLLHVVGQHSRHRSIDDYWTLTGYFNAIRELGGARALYRQDIPQRLDSISGNAPRQLEDEKALELSSRTPSTDLPAILDILNRPYPNAPDALFTTSMFGTGVDIPRVGLMVVNGQPKTTSSYIQSTGRVGRRAGALVVTFLRASRPRDLNHYEFFNGYHRQLHRFVEPATVYPFSSGTLERALGPTIVFLLRNMRNCTVEWGRDDSATLMATQRTIAPEVQSLPATFEIRARSQPRMRRPPPKKVTVSVESKLETWQSIAATAPDLQYVEYAFNKPPEHPVVLGDYQHLHKKLEVVYENSPRSLRDIEETTGFQTR